MARSPSEATRLGAGLAAVAIVTLITVQWLPVSNPAIVSTTFLMVVLLLAATSRLWISYRRP